MATGLVINKTAVYFGPSTTTYPSENSYAGPNDTVTILWKEGAWYYIEYPAGSQKKRMYITTAAVSNISGSITSYTPSLVIRYALSAGNTYAGPSNTLYPSTGSVSAGEEVKYLDGQATDTHALIEYNIAGGKKKRSWFDRSQLGTEAPQNKIMKEPINKNNNFTGDNHTDFAVAIGTPVYAMCDGIFNFGYSWGKLYQNSQTSYISLGRGLNLVPDSGWKTADGRTASTIEYGHLSKFAGYATPAYLENCKGSTWSACYSKTTTKLASKHVTCGELIGYSGNAGNSSGPHFHILLK